MQQLIGKFIYDTNGNDLRITGFRRDGKVSLTNDDTGANTAMTLPDAVALENEVEANAYAEGYTDQRSDRRHPAEWWRGRVTCKVCHEWDLYPHDHFWLEDNFIDQGVVELRTVTSISSAMDRLAGEAA